MFRLKQEEAHAESIARGTLIAQVGGIVSIGRGVLQDLLDALDRAQDYSPAVDDEPLGKYQGKMIPQHPRTWARLKELSRFQLEFALLDYVARDHEEDCDPEDSDAAALETLRVTLETNEE